MSKTDDGLGLASERSALRRKKERGSHDHSLVHAILDEGLICHVGFSDATTTYVLPTAYARIGDALYLHGALGNHMLRTLSEGAEACVCVTLLDGLVLARSTFHHSMNYRSVVLFSRGARVEDDTEKAAALEAIVEHLVPGRGSDARPPTSAELRETMIVRLSIVEGSAKVRTGPPVDEPDDLALSIWAGEIPLVLAARAARGDAELPEGILEPSYVEEHPARVRARILELEDAQGSGPSLRNDKERR